MVERPTVFVVEDDLIAAKSVAALIALMGLSTETFPSAEDFLARISEPSARRDLCGGCLVLDIRLPGISGPELHRTLVHRGINLPTILVSGHIDVEREKLPECMVCLEKPYPGSALIDWVRTALAL